MPINNQSLGKDISFTVVTATRLLEFNGLTDYDIKPMFSDLKHKDLDGTTTYAYVPDGWTISIKLERRDQALDRYFAQLEASYYAGRRPPARLDPRVDPRRPTARSSQYRYTNVVLKYDDAGNWKSDSFVAVSLTGMASRRVQVS